MRRKATWVVVADASRARFFQLSEAGNLVSANEPELIGEIAPSREIASDRPGRTFDSGGQGRHAKEPPTDPKRHAKAELAREIGRILDEKRKKHAYEHLIVVAPPQFLGDLRAAMPDAVQALVSREINKDFSMLAPDKLESRLNDALAASR